MRSSEMTYYAHTHPTSSQKNRWEPLLVHLRQVAKGNGVAPGAKQFAEKFGAAELGELLGYWHDLGKFSAKFQRYLEVASDPDHLEHTGRVDHSTFGARHAEEAFGIAGRLLAYGLAGHHGGLPNFERDDHFSGRRSPLRHRLSDDYKIEPLEFSPRELLSGQAHWPRISPEGTPGFAAAFLTRMLFSCLVDADYLWTEHYYAPDAKHSRNWHHKPLASLRKRLDDALSRFTSDGRVNQIRADVLRECRIAAGLPTGFFSLHVPTGGGKTLSSLAFAIAHAEKHGLDRVIYSIPLTTIIEQTSNTFQEILGDDSVLEVHGNKPVNRNSETAIAQRMASENFDASLIVTTNVQLLESLFSSRPSRCRKLHRIAHSVIIFDEVQTLPVHLLRPTLAAMKQLVANFGCSIVLCSATQPAILHRDDFQLGLKDVAPIISSPVELHQKLRRVTVKHVGLLDDAAVVARLARTANALCIVNSRRHANALTQQLASSKENVLHLSANMCGQHRSDIVDEIRARLDTNQPCHVISTSVMEAGVDVDFDYVMRAECGLDSIAQAAGRCNREGERKQGSVDIFAFDRKEYPTVSWVRDGIAALDQVIDKHRDDLLAPEAIEDYFQHYLWQRGRTDGSGFDEPVPGDPSQSVMGCFADAHELRFQFETADRLYRLIADSQTSVLVPYGRGAKLIQQLQTEDENAVTAGWLREFDRDCRRYQVGVFSNTLQQMLKNTSVCERFGRYYLQNRDAYNNKFGVDAGIEGMGVMVC